jgi:hypothetical protein
VTEPQYPDPSLIASIEHQGEKLGYLVSQVEEMFANHAKHDLHQVLLTHSLESLESHRKWLDGKLNDEQAAILSTSLLERTAEIQDEIKNAHTKNLNRLHQMVLDAIERGKGQQTELNTFLDGVLNDGQ